MNSPIWLTSKTPTAFLTVKCSSFRPLYETGILYPAKGTILAPKEMCFCSRATFFNSEVVSIIFLSFSQRRRERRAKCYSVLLFQKYEFSWFLIPDSSQLLFFQKFIKT